MKRVASIVAMRPEHQERYPQLHRTVWPGVVEMFRAANIANYSIYLRDGRLFAFSEHLGSDWAADMARIAADPESQRWRQLTEPCQQPLPTAQSDEAWVEATDVSAR